MKYTAEEFPARLRAAREAKGYQQSDIAQLTGLQPSAISHFEIGERLPSLENLCKLANAIGVSPDFLLSGTKKPPVWCETQGCTVTRPKCKPCKDRVARLIARGMPRSGRKA
jgi:ribosome-binding protein aMBF1 (putative translation factor)